MVDSITVEEESSHVAKPRSSSSGRRRTLAQQLMPQESPPGLADCSRKHVVVVMDGLKEFTMEPLQWVLKNMALEASCTITLLGVMPWLNLPLFSKTWSDIWSLNIEDFSIIEEKSEWKSDVLYKKVQRLTALCQQYGVKPQVRSGMGYPLPLLAVEQIASLQATLVVFDRHHQKYREYYAEKIPCDMVMMNEEGEVDIIEGGSLTDSDLESTPGIFPASSAPSPILVFAEHLRNIIFKQRS